nr:DUF4405 domain-containing protein [uncultured Desulfobulbus sp.]
MTVRKITSLTLLISFLILILTSLVLFVVPEGRVAYWSDWRWLGLSKTQWGDIHTNSGFLFLFAGLLHLFYNWKPILSYLKNRVKKVQLFAPTMIIALVINVLFVAGTLLELPPFQSILNFGSSFKEAASIKYGEPPYGHAELSPLRLFATRTDMDLAAMQAALNKAKISFTGPDQTILAIAKANNLTPKAIFDAMRPVTGADATGEAMPEQPVAGIGRKSLQAICDQYSLDQKHVLTTLKAKNIVGTADQSLKDIAAANGLDPQSVYTIIYEAVSTP